MTCPACKGSRKYRAFSIHTGKCCFVGPCFNCEATGKVDARKVETSKAALSLTGNVLYTVEQMINEAAARNDFERAEFYMRRIVADMFLIGKANARKVLDALASGEWRDDNAENRSEVRGRVECPEIRAQLRALCIELGREALAA